MTKRFPYLPAIRRISEGTIVQVDEAFTCIDEGAKRKVCRDRSTHGVLKGVPMNSRARLFIHCAEGQHFLDGSEAEAGAHGLPYDHYVGLKVVGHNKHAANIKRGIVGRDELDYRSRQRKRSDLKATRKVIRELLDCYWGTGDGDPAPEFIKRAARLSGWKAPAGSLEGKKRDENINMLTGT